MFIPYKYWEYPPCYIRDIAIYIKRGVMPIHTNNQENSILVINQKCIKDNRLFLKYAQLHNINSKKLITQKKILKKGDIVIAAIGDNNSNGRSVVIRDNINITSSNNTIILRINHNQYNYQYLQYVLQNLKLIINSLVEGSAQKVLFPKHLYHLLIPNPPLNIQNKISHIISTLDKKIDINKDIANKTIKLVEYLYKQVAITVKNKVDIITGLGKPVCGIIPTVDNREYWDNGGSYSFIDILFLKNIYGNLLINSNKYLTKKGIERSQEVSQYSVLLSNTGTVGRLAITGIKCYISRSFYAFQRYNKVSSVGIIYGSLKYVQVYPFKKII